MKDIQDPVRLCPVCNDPLVRKPGAGRLKQYCTEKCRSIAWYDKNGNSRRIARLLARRNWFKDRILNLELRLKALGWDPLEEKKS